MAVSPLLIAFSAPSFPPRFSLSFPSFLASFLSSGTSGTFAQSLSRWSATEIILHLVINLKEAWNVSTLETFCFRLAGTRLPC